MGVEQNFFCELLKFNNGTINYTIEQVCGYNDRNLTRNQTKVTRFLARLIILLFITFMVVASIEFTCNLVRSTHENPEPDHVELLRIIFQPLEKAQRL